MRVFEIVPTAKTVRWLKKNYIDINALQNALTVLYTEIKPQKRFQKTKLVLQADYHSDYSGYYFGTNKIYICSEPDFLAKTRKQRIFVIFLHFLHEFRHWMQSEVLGVKDRQLHYTERDIDLNSKAYRKNKFEIDARKFEKRYVRKFMRYYVNFRRAYR